jgi:hypothetical protein
LSHRTFGELDGAELLGVVRSSFRAFGVPPFEVHAVDIRRHDEELRLDLARQQRTCAVLVDDDLGADERA